MKGKLLVVLAVGVLAGPMAADAAVIDFDDLPSDTVLTTQYSALGVVFSAYENGSPVGSKVYAYTNHTSPNVWSNCFNSGFCNGRADVIRMDFSSLVSGLSWYTDTAGPLTPTFYAYDAGGSLLETVVATATSEGTFALTSFSAVGISYVEGLQPTDDWGYLVDTVSYTVPEPTTLLLVGCGLLGLAARRRRAS